MGNIMNMLSIFSGTCIRLAFATCVILVSGGLVGAGDTQVAEEEPASDATAAAAGFRVYDGFDG